MTKQRTLWLLLVFCAMSCAPVPVSQSAPETEAPANSAPQIGPEDRPTKPVPAPQPETPEPDPIVPTPEPDPATGFQAERKGPKFASGYSRELNVLYLEQGFRWIARFLNDCLKRDSGLAYQGYFFDAQSGWTQPTSSWSAEARKRVRPLRGPFSTQENVVPTRDEFFALGYDVILLGDVDTKNKEWQPEYFEWLEEWVKQGGGLVLLAGSKHHPESYHAIAPYERLCPVKPRNGDGPIDSVNRAEVKHLALTETGENHEITRLGSDDSENRSLFGRVTDGKYEAGDLHGIYWHATTGEPKDGAVVLAHVARAGQPVSTEHPVLVTQEYGRGRVVWIGTDDLYYWRQWTGDQYFQRFFANVIRWAANDPGNPD